MADESIKRERFGRYLILDHLVDGGMAKISRARFLGEQADKVVAIKMVQPQFSKDVAFKTMFMDEIKVTFGLAHQNVIQTYDYGEHAGQLFVAMEYCDGKNLKEYIEKLKERKFVFPVEISVYIISQACQGLYYAHTFRDKLTGLESSIIHRDISPHNIMMSYDGAIKIIDFGIAKSTKSSEQTQAGTIKGKLSYLAPEYLEGLELDPRYDQFALGITLWEMLCNRKLFKENNDLAVLKKIQECHIPVPSTINPNVPKELDAIVLKALSKDRNKRYDNLDQMNRALMKILYAKYPDFNATDLSYFSQELFREEIKKDREKLFEFGRINIKPYIEDLKNEQAGGVARGAAPLSSDKLSGEFDFEFTERNNLQIRGGAKGTDKKSENKEAKSEPQWDETLEVKKEVKKETKNEVKKDTGTKPEKIESSKATTKHNQKFNNTRTSGSSVTSQGIKRVFHKAEEEVKPNPLPGAAAAIFLLAFAAWAWSTGYFEHNKPVVKNEQVAIKKGPTPASLGTEEPPAMGTIFLTHFEKQKMQVFINDKKEEIDHLSSFKIPMHKAVILRVQIEGKKHFIKELQVDKAPTMEIEIPEMSPVSYGYMNTSAQCAEGEVEFEVFGEKRHVAIPIKQNGGIALPMLMDEKNKPQPQKFSISFIRTGEIKERKFEITIKREDQNVDLCEFL